MSDGTWFALTAAAFGCATLLMGSSPAHAQASGTRLEIGGQATALRLSEFDFTDFGTGLDVERPVRRGLTIAGSLTVFPGDRQLSRPNEFLDRSRVLGLVGLRGGPRFGRVEPYAHARAGFLRFSGGGPVACILIFPTPLACRLAAGYTTFTAEIGGGANIGLRSSGRLRLRLEASDLLVRYGLQATRRSGETTDGFVDHNPLITIGLGWRF